jgi:hypothetical protein
MVDQEGVDLYQDLGHVLVGLEILQALAHHKETMVEVVLPQHQITVAEVVEALLL